MTCLRWIGWTNAEDCYAEVVAAVRSLVPEGAWLNRLADEAEKEGREGSISMEEMAAEIEKEEETK